MTEKIKKSWKTTDNRFVAFIDLLGFKDKVMRKSHDEIYQELNKISVFREKIENSIITDSKIRNFKDVDIYIVSFSDSIALFSKNDSVENFKYFSLVLKTFFSNAITNKIALKGGMAHGKISVNKSKQIYFGQPLIDAYIIEENVDYLGIVCHNSIDTFVKANFDSKVLSKLFSFVETPLKCGNICHYNLNWYGPLYHYKKELSNDKKIEQILTIHKNFYDTVSGEPRRYIDNSIRLLNKMYKDNLIWLIS